MSRISKTLPLSLPPNTTNQNKAIWLVDALRAAIRDGRLPPGAQIPGSRDLANQLKISRGVVSSVYDVLQAEGLVEGIVGSGTYVSRNVATKTKKKMETVLKPQAFKSTPNDDQGFWRRINPEQPFVARQTEVASFPLDVWRKLAQRVLTNPGSQFFYDANPSGYEDLRVQIAHYLGYARGILCTADDILITTGIRHGLDLCLRALLTPDDRVWVERPGYAGTTYLIRALGLTAVDVLVDENGFNVENALERKDKVKLCLATPSHQSPLGVILSSARREAMLQWAADVDGYIFEDDYDGEFCFSNVRAPALKSIDTQARVIHAGSFNKSLYPTLRIGYLVLPKVVQRKILTLRGATARTNSALEQYILSSFLEDGHFAKYIRKMTRVYARKCKLAVESIETGLGKKVVTSGQHGGFHFFLHVGDEAVVRSVKSECEQAGITIDTACIEGSKRSHGLIIGYSSLREDIIQRSGHALGQILKGNIRKTSRGNTSKRFVE